MLSRYLPSLEGSQTSVAPNFQAGCLNSVVRSPSQGSRKVANTHSGIPPTTAVSLKHNSPTPTKPDTFPQEEKSSSLAPAHSYFNS